jgi:putative oxidoreductase
MYSGRSLKLWTAIAVLSTLFVLSALPKLLGVEIMADAFSDWNYPVEFMYVVGLLELAGAFLILIPAAARFGFGVLIFVMCGAMFTHLMAGEIAMIVIPLGLLIFLAVVAMKDKKEQGLAPTRVAVTG